ncbi:MAG: helix-turn-helix domain-containing protein [Faecousia sp.]
MSIGERITELRKEQNLSQVQLADAMGVSRQAVSKWENDLASPDTIKLIQLADLLDSDVEYLATGRRMVYRRPPIVIKTVETVEKIQEKPVKKVVEKVVERVVKQPPEIQYVEKPVVKKVYRTRYIRNPVEYLIVGAICLLIGILIGYFL